MPADLPDHAEPNSAEVDSTKSGDAKLVNPHNESHASSSAAVTGPNQPPKVTGFSRVNQLIRRRTTDFLAIVIIALGLIAVGGQLSHWWQTDPDELANPLLTAQELVGLDAIWGADGTAVELDFGKSPYSLRKEMVAGDAEAAVERLLDRCESGVRSTIAKLPAASPAEARLLKLINPEKPVRNSDAEGWALYRIDYPTTMIVGTRTTPSEQLPHRVACWGIALPMADRWTLFTIQPSAHGTRTGEPEIPLPPNAHRTLSLREESGAFLMGFNDDGSLKHLSEFYSKQSREFGWETIEDWVHRESSAAARYSYSSESRLFWIDVQLTRTARNRTTGLVSVTARTP